MHSRPFVEKRASQSCANPIGCQPRRCCYRFRREPALLSNRGWMRYPMDMIERSIAVTKSEFHRENWPFYWVTRVTGRYLELLEPRLKKISLDVSRWRVLSCLAEDEQISISEITEQAIVKIPTMMKIVQRMETDALVSMETRASDGRVTDVSLPDKGLRVREERWQSRRTSMTDVLLAFQMSKGKRSMRNCARFLSLWSGADVVWAWRQRCFPC